MLKVTLKTAMAAMFAGGLLAGPVIAQQPAPQQAPAAANPNERVCENIKLVGSRLAVKRVCATRAEWEERRRLDREAVDAAQRSPCVLQTTGAKGRPAC